MDTDATADDSTEEMGRTLIRFAEPFAADVGLRRLGENLRATQTLLLLAKSAWNLALLPPGQRDARLEYALMVYPSGARHAFRTLVRRMIAAKDEGFAGDRRRVKECEVLSEGGRLTFKVEAARPTQPPD